MSDPARRSRPRVSDHVVEPETWQEMVHGHVREAQPALPPHSRIHNQVDYVLNGCVADGYGVDTDLLTRFGADWDFAADTSVRRNGTDPENGARHLEELAFEIAYSQRDRELTDKARVMSERGVRRVFAIRVRGDREGEQLVAGPLMEWLAGEQRWHVLADDDRIEDPALRQPLPVRALLDAALADDAVARGLDLKGNPYLHGRIQDGYRAGRDAGALQGARQILQATLAHRGIALDPASQRRIDACHDFETLQRWALRASQVTSASELFDDPMSAPT